MKQVLADFQTGACIVEEVPAPQLRPGAVLVRNHYSLISSGTEGGTVRLGRMSLFGKARARPEQVRKVLAVARTQGVLTAYRAARRALEMPIALGYCSAGTVIAVDPGVTDLAVGERVACAGPGYANHAEIVAIPRNLCAPIPAGVSTREAAFTTLGAVALQSVRIADVRIGESVVVIGLGLVGLLVTQLLRAAGCRTFGIDVDPARVDFVRAHAWGEAASSAEANLQEQVLAWSAGQGADAVIVTAGSDDNAPIVMAGELSRRKGRVVAVGRTEMHAPRDTYLFRELELRTSMAYGPGTGDPSYEEQGLDYPFAYVRWTENRNMGAFLDLLASGRLSLAPLVSHEYAVDDAPGAFDLVTGRSSERATAVLLRYPQEDSKPATVVPVTAAVVRAGGAELSVGVIGAGSYATNEFLPLLARVPGLRLHVIASATGVRAKTLAGKYGFAHCTSDAEAVLSDADCQCVVILTRHDSHARYAAAALRAGKHVFVEKPLALTALELETVEAAWRDSARALMVGFNRRFAPLAITAREFMVPRAQPASILYRANVGYRPPEHWLHDPVQGGGVILGEACHHIDFCNWFIGAEPLAVSALALEGGTTGLLRTDNVHMRIAYADGSVATLAYLSNGSKANSAEWIEISADNKNVALRDFRVLDRYHGLRHTRARLYLAADRGHAGQLDAFFTALRTEPARIDTAGYLRSSRLALDAAAQILAPSA